MKTTTSWILLAVLTVPLQCVELPAGESDTNHAFPLLQYEVKTQVVLQHKDKTFFWFHPRVAVIRDNGDTQIPPLVMTLQKHLIVSDHYSGLYAMHSNDLGRTWTGPEQVPALDWVRKKDVDISVIDVTPGWHPHKQKIIAVGAQVRYNHGGKQLEDVERSHQTSYSVYDPQSGQWTKWKRLELPNLKQFNFARSACAQWLVEPDGSVLLPFYHGIDSPHPRSASVLRCAFDGEELKYLGHGTEMHQGTFRGYTEPSIIKYHGRYFLTIRSDDSAWVTVSKDGLTYPPPKRWTFDDGQELGSYNTQQHWLAHSDGLLLTYTRRGANNDHIFRNRAPLFIAQVDPDKLHVIRSTERVLISNRLAPLGNFGATAISPDESWVTVAEFVTPEAYDRGAKGCLYIARVLWSEPNRDVPE